MSIWSLIMNVYIHINSYVKILIIIFFLYLDKRAGDTFVIRHLSLIFSFIYWVIPRLAFTHYSVDIFFINLIFTWNSPES